MINSGCTKNVQNTANKDNTTIHNTRGKTYYCYRCGNPGHIAAFPRCPAIGKECIKCGRTGHYSKMCRDNQPRRFTSYSAQSFPTKGKVSTMSNHSPQRENSETDIESGIVVSIQDCYNIEEVNKIDPPRCNVTILDKDLQLLADSGSPWTIISKQYCLEMLGEVIDCDALCKPDLTAQNFDGSCINFLGFQEVPITFQQSKAFIKLYVAVKGVNVLGWRDQAKLGIVLNPRKREPVMVIAVTTDFAEQFVGLFPDVFTEKLGKLKGFSHTIKVKDGSIPVKQKLRGVPLSVRNELKSMLDELVKSEVIQEVESSECVSPIVLTQKPDKSLRLCVDMRALNEQLVIDCHPLPNINEMVGMLYGACVFSTFDLRSAYHQIKLTDDSRSYTSFITPHGLFQFMRMPFGLASAASVFQRAMYHIVKDVVQFVKCFQDDILIFSKNVEEHILHVKEVCSRLRKSGLTLKASKCKFFQKSVEYLGHTLSGEGVIPKKSLVEAIVNAPSPDNREKLLSFAGLCEYYSKFIQNFATKMEPLRELTRKNSEFIWSEKQELAFEQIKKDIVNAPTLKSFCLNKKCIITVDASCYGLGAVLSQCAGKNEWCVTFASRTLSATERKYAVIEKELLACTWAVEHYRNYVWGNRFILKTDHKPLGILSPGGGWNSTARIAHLMSKLQEYDFEVICSRQKKYYS